MLIIAGTYGQLGNMLKRYCHVLAFSWASYIPVYNPTFHAYVAYFEGTRVYGTGPYPVTWASHISRLCHPVIPYLYSLFYQSLRRDTFQWARFLGIHVIRLPLDDGYDLHDNAHRQALSKPIVVLHGYHFRSEPLIDTYEDRLRAFFTPIEPFRAQAHHHVALARQKATRVIGVHVRLGDYRKYRGGEYYFNRQTYQHHMDALKNEFSNESVHFVVCSDESLSAAEWAREDTTLIQSDTLVDLTVLSYCDAILGPPSSFSDWASFYGKTPRYYMLNTTEREVYTPYIGL